jgi:hypothetical protein
MDIFTFSSLNTLYLTNNTEKNVISYIYLTITSQIKANNGFSKTKQLSLLYIFHSSLPL